MAPTDPSMLDPRVECCYEVVTEAVMEQGYGKPQPKICQQRPQSLIRRLCSVIFGCKPDMDILQWRQGYVKLVAWCWVLILGPLTGWLGCAYLVANKTQVPDILYLLLFLSFYIFGLLSLAFNKKRWVSRIWSLLGMLIIFTMWAKYTTRSFTDDFERRLTMYWVMTIFYLVTIFLPLTFTDPLLLSIVC
jgi:hypothetical protein